MTLRREFGVDRPYERMDITGITGVTDAQRLALFALGAVDRVAAHDLLKVVEQRGGL